MIVIAGAVVLTLSVIAWASVCDIQWDRFVSLMWCNCWSQAFFLLVRKCHKQMAEFAWPLFFRFTFPDWLLLNLPLLSLFLNAMEGICDSGHIAIAVGRVTLLFQSWSWGTETLARNLPPKKADSFPRFLIYPCHNKKDPNGQCRLFLFPSFSHFQLVRLHSAYWMIWQEWPPRWPLKIRPEWNVWNMTIAIRAWQFGYFIVASSGL